MKQIRTCVRQTACGVVRGLALDGYEAYLGIRYAKAERWEQAVQAGLWEGEYDATRGPALPIQRFLWCGGQRYQPLLL